MYETLIKNIMKHAKKLLFRSVYQYLGNNLFYQKYKIIDLIKVISVLPTFRLIQQSLSTSAYWIKTIQSVYNLLLNGTKQNATRLKWVEYNTHAIKEHHLK